MRNLAVWLVALLLTGTGCATGSAVTHSPGATVEASVTPMPCVSVPAAGNPTRLGADQFEDGVALDVTFPSGWTGCGLSLKGSHDGLPTMLVGFWSVQFVYPNPCVWRDASGSTGSPSSAQDAANAMVAQSRSGWTTATGPERLTIDGYPVWHVQITVPDAANLDDCDVGAEAELRFWRGDQDLGWIWWVPARIAPGTVGDAYFVDLEDRTVAISTAHDHDDPTKVVEELRSIVDSVDFRPE
jgi:hypothetical protein